MGTEGERCNGGGSLQRVEGCRVTRRTLAVGVALMLIVGTLAACSSPPSLPPRTLTLELSEFSITPGAFAAQVGEPLTFKVVNTGVLEHNVSISDSSGKEWVMQSVKPGQTTELLLQPSSAGEWAIICTLPGHTMAGMTARMMVDP